jgi:hypothetical protein
MATGPNAFVSYSYDDEDHVEWVLRFATALRNGGVDAILDKWDLKAGQDVAHFMEQGIAAADRVLLVCTEPYVKKADAGAGGVGYEKMIVTKEIVANIATDKFIPIIRRNPGRSTPVCLGARKYIDFDVDGGFDTALEELLRSIHGAPRHPKPPLGPNPFASSPTPSVQTQSRSDVLSDPWFAKHRAVAMTKVKAFSPGTMEICFGAQDWRMDADQKVLLSAAEKAAVHTFGWPIGVVLNTDDGKPRPTNDGLLAQIEGQGFSDRAHFDYWTLRKNGDFYIAHNIFEDGRKPDALFFNTRMVRVAEGLMYCRNLYRELGFPAGTNLQMSVRHTGLKGRVLSTSNPNRMLSPFPRVSQEDEVHASVLFQHPIADQTVVALTKSLLDPLFVLFDFYEPDDVLYDEVVTAFMNGRAT